MPISQFKIVNNPEYFTCSFGEDLNYVNLEYELDLYGIDPLSDVIQLYYELFQNGYPIIFENNSLFCVSLPYEVTNTTMLIRDSVGFFCLEGGSMCSDSFITIEVQARLSDGSKLRTNFAVYFI